MEDVTHLVAKRLKALWPDIPVFRENQADGFPEPSFYIHRRPMTMRHAFSGIQERSYQFQLVYFPDPEKPHKDMDLMIEALGANFTEIPNYARLNDVEFEPADTELHMMFSVFVRAFPVDDPVKQETLDYQGDIANGKEN